MQRAQAFDPWFGRTQKRGTIFVANDREHGVVFGYVEGAEWAATGRDENHMLPEWPGAQLTPRRIESYRTITVD